MRKVQIEKQAFDLDQVTGAQRSGQELTVELGADGAKDAGTVTFRGWAAREAESLIERYRPRVEIRRRR